MSNPVPNKFSLASARYTPEGIASLAAFFRRIPELSLEQRNTAARAILRANKSQDDTGTTCKDGGLDWLYIDLHGLGSAQGDEAKQISHLQDRTMRDVLDAISVLERTNGGVTLFLHAVSAKPKHQSDTDITVDVYFTPRERLGNKKLSSDIAHFVHQFSTKIAQPHLDRFLSRCQYNAVTPPLRKVYGRPLILSPARLPPAHGAIPGYMLCECRRSEQRTTGYPIVISDDEDDNDKEGSLDLDAQPAPRIITNDNDKKGSLDLDARPAPRISTDDGFKGAIISIGPETDSTLSQYMIPDDFIPRLRVLSQTVRSSDWKFKLRTADYGLTLEQALHISEAMVHDIENRPGLRVQVISYKKTALFLLSVLLGLVYTFFVN